MIIYVLITTLFIKYTILQILLIYKCEFVYKLQMFTYVYKCN